VLSVVNVLDGARIFNPQHVVAALAVVGWQGCRGACAAAADCKSALLGAFIARAVLAGLGKRWPAARTLVLQRHAQTITLGAVMMSKFHRCFLLVVVLLQQAALQAQFPAPGTLLHAQARTASAPTASEQEAMERLGNQAWRLHRVGKFTEAEKPYRSLIILQQRVLGTEHPETLESRCRLGDVLYQQAKYDKAEKEYRAVLKIRERTLGAEHIDIESSRFDLTFALNAQQKHAESEVEYRKMLQVVEHSLGDRHRDTLLSCCNLACCLLAQGKLPEALALARRAETGDNEVLGLEDADSKRAKRVRMDIEAAMKQQPVKP